MLNRRTRAVPPLSAIILGTVTCVRALVLAAFACNAANAVAAEPKHKGSPMPEHIPERKSTDEKRVAEANALIEAALPTLRPVSQAPKGPGRDGVDYHSLVDLFIAHVSDNGVGAYSMKQGRGQIESKVYILTELPCVLYLYSKISVSGVTATRTFLVSLPLLDPEGVALDPTDANCIVMAGSRGVAIEFKMAPKGVEERERSHAVGVCFNARENAVLAVQAVKRLGGFCDAKGVLPGASELRMLKKPEKK